VGTFILLLAVFGAGIATGLKFGGHLAIRRIRDFEHAERRRRAGLG
jgi:hypothetical protein